jgi:hypothetical protein
MKMIILSTRIDILNELIHILTTPDIGYEPMNSIISTNLPLTTVTTRVPSNQCVAMIVGINHSRISKLSLVTNTIIHFSNPGFTPEFIITGHPDIVLIVKEAIEYAGIYYSSIIESKTRIFDGEVSRVIRVPLKYKRRIIGRGGYIINKISLETNTRIVSFANGSFEVIGSKVCLGLIAFDYRFFLFFFVSEIKASVKSAIKKIEKKLRYFEGREECGTS